MQPVSAGTATTSLLRVPAGTLRIHLLGGFRIARDDQELADADWRLSKARNIIKLLALAPSHQIHREYLIDLLWPDLNPASADNNFHQALHAARRAFGMILDETMPSPAIRLRQGIVSFHPDIPIWIDIDAFTEVSRAAIGSDDPARYYTAIDLYGGELLPEDRFEEWAAIQREALQQQHLDLLRQVAHLHEARDEATGAIDVYRRIVAVDPVAEGAHVGLMRLYAQTGRRQQALRQFERLRDALAAELDTEPEVATERLYVDILDNRFPAEGVAEPVQISRERPAAPPPDDRSGFVDRIGEMRRLVGFLDRALAGNCQVVAIGGEPGIGKTRLVEEFAARARQRGAVALWGRCLAEEGSPAFWPWTQIVRNWIRERDSSTIASAMGAGASDIARIVPELRQQLPDLSEPLAVGADDERYRLYISMTEFLRNAARYQPLALMLDDLHWADHSSLMLLEFVLNELRDSAIIGVGTYRHSEVDRGHPLTRILAAISRFGDDRRLLMSGFGAEDVAEMAKVTSGQAPSPALANAIHEQTEGNPFFVREVVRLLVDEGRYDQLAMIGSWRVSVPQGVSETIGLRLGRLSGEALRLMTVAAVAGRDFDLPVVTKAADMSIADALDLVDEGLRTAIIEEDDEQPDRLRFAHALIRQTLYEETSRARRIRLHRRVGEAIEEHYADDLEPWLADLAGHFTACAADGDPEQGIHYTIEAGRQSLRRIAYGEASDFFRQALRLIDASQTSDDARRAELLILLADALRFQGETQDARVTYARAADVASSNGHPELLARSAIGIALTEAEAAVDDVVTLQRLDQALAALPDDARALRASALASLSLVLQYHDPASLPRRRQLSQQAVDLARQAEDPATLAMALNAKLDADWEPIDLRAILRLTDEVLELASATGNGGLALLAHTRRFAHLLELGDVASADAALNAYADLTKELRLPYNIWSVTWKRAMREMMSGRYEEAERLMREAYEIGQRAAPVSAHPIYLYQQFVLLRERGGLEKLESDLRRYADNLPLPERFERCLIAILCCDAGRHHDARTEVTAIVGDGLSTIPANIFWLGVISLLADICSQLGDIERCRELYQVLVPFEGRIASSGTVAISIGPISYFLGLLAATLGDIEAAERHLRAAIELSQRHGMLPSTAHARYALASVLTTRSTPQDLDEAAVLLATCEQEARMVGMTRLLEQIAKKDANGTALRNR